MDNVTNNGTRKGHGILRIQPEYSCRAAWEALARREKLEFEVLELSTPPMLYDVEEDCWAWYRGSGLVHGFHGAFVNVNPASWDQDFRALSQQRCRESCARAAALGAQQVVFHASAEPFLRGSYIENWSSLSADFFTELAQTYGLTVCVENSQDVDPEPIRRLLSRAGEGVAVCLDLGHANYSDTPLEGWFDKLGDSIVCMHLSDNLGKFDDHLPLGSGTVDWEMANRLWNGLGRDVAMTFEVGGIQGVEQSLQFLHQRGYFGLEVTK